ncbi:hypothetical protein KUTeg_022035 [Tegillarca granosa]|uniref:Uncharacterized protein n=1 Tax=Tegillarca granosa TaxID=220873 RepID=A0ABQ9E525_TEGGR|nr:hypothetical protein KUTeg_022035 [Tegillarca granosa]
MATNKPNKETNVKDPTDSDEGESHSLLVEKTVERQENRKVEQQNSDDNDKDIEVVIEQQSAANQAIDGGYGWLVVFGSFYSFISRSKRYTPASRGASDVFLLLRNKRFTSSILETSAVPLPLEKQVLYSSSLKASTVLLPLEDQALYSCLSRSKRSIFPLEEQDMYSFSLSRASAELLPLEEQALYPFLLRSKRVTPSSSRANDESAAATAWVLSLASAIRTSCQCPMPEI